MDERRTLSLNVFLNTLEEGCKNERRYCFILGAGASKTSGIPTGEELAKQWHGEILEQCSKEEIKELKKRLGVRSTKPSSRAYFDLYAMRFLERLRFSGADAGARPAQPGLLSPGRPAGQHAQQPGDHHQFRQPGGGRPVYLHG